MHSPDTTKRHSRRNRRPSYKILESANFCRMSKRHRGLVRQTPQKTTRVEVVVPTWRQVRDARLERHVQRESEAPAVHGPEPQEPTPGPAPLQVKTEDGDDATRNYFLLQAKIKVEVKTEETIPENGIRDRLALIGYETFDIKIPREILDATATREFMTRIWGGSKQATFPKIGKEFTHGLDDFMYISPSYAPHAPRSPGSPGLFFRFTDEGDEWPQIMRLIVRLRDRAWQYMGQYKMTAAPPLTPDEWDAQPLKIKRKWANKLSERKLDGGLKAKLVLWRRHGREPTPQEIAAALQSDERFQVSADEILEACDLRRAMVRVWCMRCVGYDVAFQRRIAAGH